jgi:uncharacterized protein (TIGR02598 family)
MKIQHRKQTEGFTLIEVVIGLVVAAVCIFFLQRLLPTSLKVAANATDQTAASSMMTAIAQDLRNTPAGSTTSPGFGITLPVDTTNSSALISTNLYLSADGLGVLSPSQARYAATIWMSNAASATVTSLTTARIKVYWPASANVSNALGSVETITSFNRQLQLNGAYVANNGAVASASASPTGTGSDIDGHDNGKGNNYQNEGVGNGGSTTGCSMCSGCGGGCGGNCSGHCPQGMATRDHGTGRDK